MGRHAPKRQLLLMRRTRTSEPVISILRHLRSLSHTVPRLKKCVPSDRSHLKRILRGYFGYYNNDRSHLGLAKESPVERPISKMTSVTDQLLEMPRLGGLHHRYEWQEAS